MEHSNAKTPAEPLKSGKPETVIELDTTTYMLYNINVTAKEIMKILKANGWKLQRIEGSHHIFCKQDCRPVPVPFHGNTDLGIMGKLILKQAGIKN